MVPTCRLAGGWGRGRGCRAKGLELVEGRAQEAAGAGRWILQLSICLSTSFIEFCSQKMMAMGLMLTSCTGIEGFLNELWFSWNSILPVG